MGIMKRRLWVLGLVIVLSLGAWPLASAVQDKSDQSEKTTLDKLDSLQMAGPAVEAIEVPKTPQPQWYKDQVAAEQAAAAAASQSSRRAAGGVFTYTVKTDASQSSLATFSTLASETLNDPRGWSQLGVTFKEVPSGGQFNLILAAAHRLPAYSSGCSADWSCRVGVSVIINENRWNGATDAWNSAGGNLRDYRHMVINHEVGHWLGHGHASCPRAGAYAPLMLQQSINLNGCKFNPWPLASELWTSR